MNAPRVPKTTRKHAGRPASRTRLRVSPVERTTLNEQVYHQLGRVIMEGQVEPGSTFTIRGLAESFGVSPMPVRVALRRLVTEHALVMLPNHSVALPVITREKFDEITRIRVALEGLAAEVAAARMLPADVRRMERLNAGMEAAGGANTTPYLANNREFHFTLYERAELPTLLAMIRSLWLQIGPVLAIFARSREMERPHAEIHHRAVLAGLHDGDVERVRRAIESDILVAAETIASTL